MIGQVRLFGANVCQVLMHLLYPSVKNVLKKIGHKPGGGGSNCKVTENKRFYNALLLD